MDLIFSLLVASFFGFLSLASFFLFQIPFLKNNAKYFIALSAGALLGDAFFHIIPHTLEEAIEENLSLIPLFVSFVLAVVVSFTVESFLRWRECCNVEEEGHIHSKKTLAFMNLFGDSWCNFIDGITIVVAFMASPAIGFATSVAIFLHELPQEIGDFATLIHSGFSKKRALILNFLISLCSVVGVFFGWLIIKQNHELEVLVLMYSAGSLTYLSMSNLIPEVHNFHKKGFNWLSYLLFLLGIILLFLLSFLEV
jgi:zinc and cadmium transporter